MSNLLSTAKKLLTEQAIQVYQDFSDDIPLTKEDFKAHYAGLGEILFEIQSLESFSQLIVKIEKNDFAQIGFFGEDDLEDFLDRVRNNQ